MLQINDVTNIYLGIQGENESRTIQIDMSAWMVGHPNASVSIWHKRNGDETPSTTGATYDTTTQILTWVPTSTDTYVSGEGDAEIRMTESNVIKKSRAVKTGVSPSVTGAGVPLGSDWQSYIDEVDRLKSIAVEYGNDAIAAAEDAEAYAVGTRGGEAVESTDPTYHNNARYYAEELADAVSAAAGSAEDAEEAKADAITAKNAAVAAASDANAAKEAAVSAKNDAVSAKNDAVSAKNAAASSANSASSYASTAQTAKNNAVTARNAATGAATAASGYANNAQSYANTANTAKNNAVEAYQGAFSAASQASSYAGQASSSKSAAANSASAAATSKRDAEAYAVGKRNGVDVGSTDPTYHYNSKYFCDQAEAAQTAAETAQGAAEAWATGGSSGTPSATNNAQYYAEEAAESAATAEAAAENLAVAYEDLTFPVSKGKHCLYDGGYYIAKQDISTSEEWTSGHWEAAIVGDEISSQKALESSKADAIEVTDSTPASVMTFSDGANGMPMSATFEIAPVQDLHGQANPYPGGAGKNKYDMNTLFSDTSKFTISGNGVTGLATDISLVQLSIPSALVGQQLTFSATISIPAAATGGYMRVRAVVDGSNKNGTAISAGTPGLSSVTFTPASTDDKVVFAYGSMSGQSATISEIQLEVGSTNSTFAPYVNLCPITGWTGCKPSRTGKNLLNESGTDTSNGYVSGKRLNSDGTEYASSGAKILEYTKVKPNTAYVWHMNDATANAASICFYDKDKNYISGVNMALAINKSLTTPANAAYCRATKTMGATEDQLEEGTAFTSYESFGTTYPISFPAGAGTVYGGTITVNKDGTGKLTVDWLYFLFDGSEDESFTLVSNSGGNYAYITAGSNLHTIDGHVISNMYPQGAAASNTDVINSLVQNTFTRFYIHPSWMDNNTTVSDLKAYYAENNLAVLAEVSTPVEYTITTSQVNAIITSLKGTNNLWADCGDVLSVDYSADTKLYVDGKISEGMKLIALLLTANHENGMKASKAYASGDLLTVGNTLYKATTSIANGATLTAGTNVTETTIETELDALA